MAALLLVGAEWVDYVQLAPLRPPKVVKASELGQMAAEAGALWWIEDAELRSASEANTKPGELGAEVVRRARGRAVANAAGVYGGHLADRLWRTPVLSPPKDDMDQIVLLTQLLTGFDAVAAERLYFVLNHEARTFVSANEGSIRIVAEVLETKRHLAATDLAALLAPETVTVARSTDDDA